jgi:hypothetical protein
MTNIDYVESCDTTMLTASDLENLTDRLAKADGPADICNTWPDEIWAILSEFRAFHWLVPQEFGGEGCDRLTLMQRYLAIAQGSLTAAFMLTQHDAAIRRIIPAVRVDTSGEPNTAAKWLSRIVSENLTTTVGISQLTISIRRGERAMGATPTANGGYRLDGFMPWVTGAEKAAVFVTGGTIEDGRQILALVPSDRPGVMIQQPEPLAALNASRTTEVMCQSVEIQADEVLAGPIANVITSKQAGGTGGLETSVLALGQSLAAITFLKHEDPTRFDLEVPVERLESEWTALKSDIFSIVSGDNISITPEQIRQRANALASRSTQACLIARRGSGFLLTDPAQRWARQALFFHVWSCPKPVATASIRDLAGMGESNGCGVLN